MYQRIAPIFLVADVDKGVEWYTHSLGARLQATLPENRPFEWASLILGNVEIMFAQRTSAQRWYTGNVIVSEKPANFITYVYVKDVHDLYDRIRNKVKIIMEPTDQLYGIRELAIQDPFNMVLIFAQVL